MTNLILKAGRLVHFQSNAIVYTNVPTRYRGLCKMLLRWARSNIRETIALSRFGYTRFRKEPVLSAQVDLSLHWLRMVTGESSKFVLAAALIAWPQATITSLLGGVVVASLLPMFFYFFRYKSMACLYAIPYSVFMLFGLSWVSLYALFTPHKNGWLTRTIAAPRQTPVHAANEPAPVLAKTIVLRPVTPAGLLHPLAATLEQPLSASSSQETLQGENPNWRPKRA